MAQPPSDQSQSLINTLMRNPSNLFASLHNQTLTHAHASQLKATKQPLVALFNPSLPTAEGYEHDKLLAFQPSSTPVTRQVAIIGLWIALHEFASTFGNTSEGAIHAVETAQRHLVSTPLRDDDPQGPTLLLVAPTPLSVTLGTLQSWLRRLRAALRLVDDLAQAQAVLDCLATRHPLPTGAHAPPPDAVPFLQPAQKTALSVQCLADSLQLYSLGGICPIRHVLIAHAGRCLYSSVGLEDTAALHCCLAEVLTASKRPSGSHCDGCVVAAVIMCGTVKEPSSDLCAQQVDHV